MKKVCKAISSLFVSALMVGGWILAGKAVHVVLSPGSLPGVGKVTVVPKERLAWGQTFRDTRKWTVSDLARHPELAERLMEAGKGHVLEHLTALSASSATTLESGLLTNTHAAAIEAK